jgi:hypothetical protein
MITVLVNFKIVEQFLSKNGGNKDTKISNS